MIRSKLFHYRTSKRVFEHFFLKNSNNFSVKNSHQCLTTLTNNLDQKTAVSNLQKEPEVFKQKEKFSEKEFLVRLKNDPDKFGNQQEEEVEDEGDIREEKFFSEQPLPTQRLTVKQYADKIKTFIRQRRIKEAIDFVEVKMIKEDRVKPDAYIFNLLLGACGRVGYTKKAFMLYNNMKKRGLKVMGGTYTALFNACSNSPWPTTDGLTRATQLRDIMIEKGHAPNTTTYNAIIKAFGRGGDISTAFLIVDEMLHKGFVLKDDTINFLLQACITDKESGFRHTLLVWRKMIEKKIKPSVYTYNLLLRGVRDCGLGDEEVLQGLINQLIPDNNLLLSSPATKLLDSEEKKLLEQSNISQKTQDSTRELDSCEHIDEMAEITNLSPVNKSHHYSIDKYRPNLLADTPHLGNIVSLSEVKKPEDRLFLIGGFKGFLENMDQHKCKPDIKTITQLLDCIPSTSTAENELLSCIKNYKLKPDIDFFNMLIKKKSMRFDYEGGREVLSIMKKYKYRPDVVTYGVLALGCETKYHCDELINEMKEAKYSLNVQILGAMLRKACHNNDFDYALHIMELCHTENVNPSKKFIEIIDQFRTKCRQLYDQEALTKKERKSYIDFKKKYTAWLDRVHIDESEDAHPWQQFRQTSEENKYYKGKDNDRFKPIHRSLFKVKTSKKYVQISK